MSSEKECDIIPQEAEQLPGLEDTITINSIDYSALDLTASTMLGASGSYSIPVNYPSPNLTITSGSAGSVGASGSFLYSNGTSPIWTTTLGSGNISPSMHVNGDAEFEGDIKWKGRSLSKLLESIEDRLAILPEPDPAKLEKHAALKKAYEHYKLMERLIGED